MPTMHRGPQDCSPGLQQQRPEPQGLMALVYSLKSSRHIFPRKQVCVCMWRGGGWLHLLNCFIQLIKCQDHAALQDLGRGPRQQTHLVALQTTSNYKMKTAEAGGTITITSCATGLSVWCNC